MDSTLVISRSLCDEIAASAAASSDEICGLLLGGQRVSSILHCRNVHPDPARNFEVDPAALIAAHRAQRSGSAGIVGCFHSHPSGSTTPSPRDAEAAAPDGWFWLIAAGSEFAAWRAVRDGAVHGRFDPVELRVSQGCA